MNETNQPAQANVLYCSKCGAKNLASFKFCQSCGQGLASVMTPAKKSNGVFWAVLIVTVLLVFGGITAVTMSQLNGAASNYQDIEQYNRDVSDRNINESLDKIQDIVKEQGK